MNAETSNKQNATTINTYNKSAINFQNKFMNFDLHHDTYKLFCDLIEKENAEIFEIGCGPRNVTKYLLTKKPSIVFKRFFTGKQF